MGSKLRCKAWRFFSLGLSCLFLHLPIFAAVSDKLDPQDLEHSESILDELNEGNRADISWLQEMRESGYCASELKGRGSLNDFYQAGFPVKELLDVFDTSDFSKAKLPASKLRAAGVTARKMRIFGYQLEELAKVKYAFIELFKAGYDPEEIAKMGYTNDEIVNKFNLITLVRAASYGPEKLEKLGFSLEVIREYRNGYCYDLSLDNLIKAGYMLSQIIEIDENYYGLRDFQAQELKDAGLRTSRLYDLFKDRWLGCLRGVCSFKELKEYAGLYQLQKVGYPLEDFLDSGVPMERLISERLFRIEHILAKGYTRDHIDLSRCLNCPVADLKKLKFNLIELKEAKFSLYRLKDNFDLAELKAAKFQLADLKKECRYNFRDYVEAGFTLQELADAGFTAVEFKSNRYSARTLIRLGFSARNLKYAGYTFCERRGCSFN